MTANGFGSRLRHYRELAGFRSAEDLAAQVGNGLSRNVIANLETGRTVALTPNHLVALCKALGVTAATLIPELVEEADFADIERKATARIAARVAAVLHGETER